MLNEFVTLCEIGKEGSESRTLLLAVVLEYVHAKSCSDSRTGNIVRDALDEGNLLDLAVNPRSTTRKIVHMANAMWAAASGVTV